MVQQNEYSLTPEEVELFTQIGQQVIRLQQQAAGAVMLILKQHKLEGNWSLSPDQTKLVRSGNA